MIKFQTESYSFLSPNIYKEKLRTLEKLEMTPDAVTSEWISHVQKGLKLQFQEM